MCLIVLFTFAARFGINLLIGFSWAIAIFVSGINLFLFISISVTGVILLLLVTFYLPKFEYIKNRLISFLIHKQVPIIFNLMTIDQLKGGFW